MISETILKGLPEGTPAVHDEPTMRLFFTILYNRLLLVIVFKKFYATTVAFTASVVQVIPLTTVAAPTVSKEQDPVATAVIPFN